MSVPLPTTPPRPKTATPTSGSCESSRSLERPSIHGPQSLAADLMGIFVPLGILGLGAGVLVFSIINRPQQETSPEERVIPKVQTVTAIPYQQNFEIDVVGVVVPHREIQLPTEVSGQIIRRAQHCRAGRFVKAGEVLFEVDPLDYELELKRLQQEQQQARLRIEETKVDLANTKQLLELAERDFRIQEKDVQRMTALSARKAVAQADLDRALRGQVTARNALQVLRNRQNLLDAQLASAKTALELATTKVEVAKLDLERTKIRAPIDGIVVEEKCEVDSFVQKGATLVTIEDTSSVEVLCNLRTDQIAWLWRFSASNSKIEEKYELPPAPADVVFESGGREYVWQGVVSRYDGIGLDPRTRTVPCRIHVSDPTAVALRADGEVFDPERTSGSQGETQLAAASIGGPTALVRGMFVDVRIHVPPTSNDELLSVPVKAVRPGNIIWVLSDNKLEARKARIAKTLRDQVLIRRDESEIGVDDRIIVTPLPAATDGMPVEEVSST